MLIEFSVSNVLSFSEKTTFSMRAGKITKKHKNHVRKIGGENVVRGAALYGANASGKSNLLKCLAYVERMMISNSCACVAGRQFKMGNGICPVMSFEITYEYNEHVFRYEVDTDGAEVLRETLVDIGQGEDVLYERTSQKMSLGKRLSEYSWYENRTCRSDAFFLMKLLEDGIRENRKTIPESKLMLDACWGMRQFLVIDATRDTLIGDKFYAKLKEEEYRTYLVALLKWADMGIDDVGCDKLSDRDAEMIIAKYKGVIPGSLSDGWSKVVKDGPSYYLLMSDDGRNITVKEICCKHGNRWFRAGDESQGTCKLIQLSSMLFQLARGKLVWCVDEFDSKLHTILTRELLKQFMDLSETKSQLIVTLHDTNQMTHDIWRTDEICLVSKNKKGVSKLHRLDSFSPRFDKKLIKGYFNGDYGALPNIH